MRPLRFVNPHYSPAVPMSTPLSEEPMLVTFVFKLVEIMVCLVTHAIPQQLHRIARSTCVLFADSLMFSDSCLFAIFDVAFT